jgi:hypothetical protein
MEMHDRSSEALGQSGKTVISPKIETGNKDLTIFDQKKIGPVGQPFPRRDEETPKGLLGRLDPAGSGVIIKESGNF